MPVTFEVLGSGLKTDYVERQVAVNKPFPEGDGKSHWTVDLANAVRTGQADLANEIFIKEHGRSYTVAEILVGSIQEGLVNADETLNNLLGTH